MSAELPADSPDGAADDTPKVKLQFNFVGLIWSIPFYSCVSFGLIFYARSTTHGEKTATKMGV